MKPAVTLCYVLAFLLFFPCTSLARIPIVEGSEDLTELFGSAGFVFHARIVNIDRTTDNAYGSYSCVATLDVDRWYKGTTGAKTVRLRFAYSRIVANGHSCIDLGGNAYWLLFATEVEPGLFKFSDDCYGGLPVSSILADTPNKTGIRQLQNDLVAGLQDQDPAARLENIKRLGGLKLASSHDPLQPFVDHGTNAESKWAVYAALRSGDLSVLPNVESIVISLNQNRIQPDGLIALETAHLRSWRAVPSLINILESAKMDFARGSAAQALEAIRDPQSVPILAKHLSDSDETVSYYCLIAIGVITHEPSCTLPEHWQDKEGEVDRCSATCRQWWQTKGSSQSWSQLLHP